MNAKVFSGALGEVNDKYVSEAIEFKAKKKKPTGVRWGIMAACLCLIMGSITVMAASGLGTRMIAFFTDRVEPGTDFRESGYRISAQIEKLPVSSLKGAVREAEGLIRQQYQQHSLFSSRMPGDWQRSFATRTEACDYIGLDALKQLDWDLSEQGTKLNVYGDADGDIHSLILETDYMENEIRLQFFSRIYTENDAGEITLETVTTERVAFTELYYATGSGKQCHMVESSALESGYLGLDGYLVDSGILYQLHIAYLEKDGEQAKNLMYQWADLF